MRLRCGIPQTLSKAQMQHHMNCTLEPKNLMFIGVSDTLWLLRLRDSLLILCACVLIVDSCVQAHHP